MTLDILTRRDVTTSLGVVPVWSRPQALESNRLLVLGVAGLFAGPDDLSRLPNVVQPIADAAVVRMPGSGPPPLADHSPEGFSRALDEVIGQLFSERQVVLLGVSIGATAALGVRSPGVRRVVAVEPILATEELWPLVAPLRAHLRDAPPSGPATQGAPHDLYWRLFGVGVDRLEPRDHRHLLQGLRVPVDVLLSGRPLEPERPLETFPSLVSAAERERLAALPQVRLHVAGDVGHNVQGGAGKQLTEVLFEACRRASADPPYAAQGLDEPLVEAVPLTARRVAHWGPGGRAFAGAYLAWNPAATVTLLGEDAAIEPPGADGFDAVALGAPPPAQLLGELAAALRPGGDLVARWAAADRAPRQVREALSGAGLALGPPVDAAGTGVLRARRAAAFPPPLRVELAAFAPRLMDVRTRLPARGLRSDPELIVDYVIPPYTPGPLPPDAPKVLVLQRQGPMTLEAARGQMAFAIARGWILVIEYDDHPGLVAETLGRPFTEQDLDRFGYAHAVQTSTAALAELFGRCNPEVRIFENTVFELAPIPAARPPRRVFYGAVSRGGFGVEVARSLAPVTAEFPDLEFVVLGDRAVFEALPTANKRFEDYLAYEAYLARMAECAISLSPIEPLPMRETKSDAKFLDAARAGVVTIGSPLIYAETIEHAANGLLAPGLEDWAAMLRRALADPAATRAMGRRAWDHVRAERMFAGQVARRREWCRELWARREALNRSACERIPGLAEAVAAERATLGG